MVVWGQQSWGKLDGCGGSCLRRNDGWGRGNDSWGAAMTAGVDNWGWRRGEDGDALFEGGAEMAADVLQAVGVGGGIDEPGALGVVVALAPAG